MKRIYMILMILSIGIFLVGCNGEAPEQEMEDEEPSQGEGTSDGEEEMADPEEEEKSDTAEKIQESIKGLMAKGASMKCTFSAEEYEGIRNYDQVLWIDGEKFRTEVKMDAEEYMEVYSISDGEYMYSWSNMNTEGTKLKLESMEEMADEYSDTSSGSIDTDVKFDYSCLPWVVTNDKFVPPSDVEFQDLTAMMEEAMQQLEDMDIEGFQ